MNSDNGFHLVEKNDKLYLIYHHPKYQPIQQTQSSIPYGEATNNDNPLQPLFLCPNERCCKQYDLAIDTNHFTINSSPENQARSKITGGPTLNLKFGVSENLKSLEALKSAHKLTLKTMGPKRPFLSLPSLPSRAGPAENEQDDHHVLPLFWCNNEEFDVNGGCYICRGSKFGTDYYFCDHCDEIYHKECVESPSKIKHPYHPEHSLQLYFDWSSTRNIECLFGLGSSNLQSTIHPLD